MMRPLICGRTRKEPIREYEYSRTWSRESINGDSESIQEAAS